MMGCSKRVLLIIMPALGLCMFQWSRVPAAQHALLIKTCHVQDMS